MSDWRLFSRPWSERPVWSRGKDIISIGITAAILALVIWEAAGRWLGH